MSSLMSSIAPRPTVWETARGLELPHAGPGSPSRIDGAHELPAAPVMHVTPSQGAAIVRQRFYPAQLRRLVTSDLQSLVSSRKHRLIWSGWDRSLPRMYLPVEALQRLLLEAVDGITRATQPVGPGSATINVRIESSRQSDATITLAMDAQQWQCDARLHGALNARWFQQRGASPVWQRLVRQCDLVGGWLSISKLAGGGSSLLIHLPTDQPRALVHSWLNRLMGTVGSKSTNSGASRVNLSLYAIGRSQPETLEQLRAANVRLQSLASDGDYIYRACHGRWIWLTSQLQLPPFVNTAAWQSQHLDCWTCAADSAAIVDISHQIERRFRQLLGTRVPPLDLRTDQVSRGPISPRQPNTRVDNAVSISKNSHLNMRSHAQISARKWRYPI